METTEEIYQCRFAVTPQEIQSYSALCKQIYSNVYNIDIDMDEYDVLGNVVLALKNREIVGGIRISILSPHSMGKLPLEKYGFNLKNIMPHIANYKYCELGRFCVMASAKGTSTGKKLLDFALRYIHSQCCRYVFSFASALVINYNKRIFASLGYNYVPTPHKRFLRTTNNCIEFTLSEIDLEDNFLGAVKFRGPAFANN